MTVLIIGLVLFLGIHFTRIVAEEPRARCIAKHGPNAWKGVYSLISALGLGLTVWGYGLARQSPQLLWAPLPGSAHIAALLTLIAFVLLAAAYVPNNGIKRAVGHPMMAGTAIWALAHLPANGTLADLLLFGGFFVWSVLGFLSARGRDQAAAQNAGEKSVPVSLPPASALATSLTVGIGAAAWAVFAMWLHVLVIGVKPLG